MWHRFYKSGLFLLTPGLLLAASLSIAQGNHSISVGEKTPLVTLFEHRYSGEPGAYFLDRSDDLLHWTTESVAMVHSPFPESGTFVSLEEGGTSRGFYRMRGPIDDSEDFTLEIVSNPASPHLATLSYGEEFVVRLFGTRNPDTALPDSISFLSMEIGGQHTQSISMADLNELATALGHEVPQTSALGAMVAAEKMIAAEDTASYAPHTHDKKGLLVINPTSCAPIPPRDPVIQFRSVANNGFPVPPLGDAPFPIYPKFLYFLDELDPAPAVYEYTLGFTTLGIDSGFENRALEELQENINDFIECVDVVPSLDELELGDFPEDITEVGRRAFKAARFFLRAFSALCMIYHWPTEKNPLPLSREFADGFSTKSASFYGAILDENGEELYTTHTVEIDEDDLSNPHFWVTGDELPTLVIDLVPEGDCDTWIVPSADPGFEGWVQTYSAFWPTAGGAAFESDEETNGLESGRGSSSSGSNQGDPALDAASTGSSIFGEKSLSLIARTRSFSSSIDYVANAYFQGKVFFELGEETPSSVELALTVATSAQKGLDPLIDANIKREGSSNKIVDAGQDGEYRFVAQKGVRYLLDASVISRGENQELGSTVTFQIAPVD